MKQLHGLQTLSTQIVRTQFIWLHVYITHMCSAEEPPSLQHVNHLRCEYISNTHKTWHKERIVVLGMLNFCHCIPKAL